MRFSVIFLAALFFLISCDDDTVPARQLIVYKELQADAVYLSTVNVDMDNNGDPDFLVSTTLTSDGEDVHVEYKVYAVGANQVFDVAGRVALLSEGQAIAPGNPFTKNTEPLVTKVISATGDSWRGDWVGITNGFVGVRFNSGDGKMHYGWIRLSFNAEREAITVHDYAYHANPKVAINAGQKAG